MQKRTNQNDFGKWIEQHKEEVFWYKHRILHDLDPENINMFEEARHWRKIGQKRKQAKEATDVFTAVTAAPYFDKQHFMSQWWGQLTDAEKEEVIIYVWGNKGDNIMYGHDWWYPYFEELGFVSNTSRQLPQEPVTLYRAAEPYFARGMSWTDEIKMARVFQQSNLKLLGDKYIYSVTVKPEQILAMVEGNVIALGNEEVPSETLYSGVEFVLNHRSLPNELERVETE